jgi:biotin carboxyl carrier protein
VQHEIEISGRTRRVLVSRAGDGFAVSIDGRMLHVNAARVDARTLSLLVNDPSVASGVCRSYEVTVVPDAAAARLVVSVGSTPILVGLNGRRRLAQPDEGAHAGSGPERVSAPMPGKIIRVLVHTRETVRARQPLIVVEAMKMENELRAGRGGTVAEIHVQEGQSVEAGALLVVIQ